MQKGLLREVEQIILRATRDEERVKDANVLAEATVRLVTMMKKDFSETAEAVEAVKDGVMRRTAYDPTDKAVSRARAALEKVRHSSVSIHLN